MWIDSVCKTMPICKRIAPKALWNISFLQNPPFYSVFIKIIDPNFLQYGQSLYQAHIGHSWVSSIAIGPLYLQRAHPTSPSQKIMKTYFGIQNPSRRNLGIILSYRKFSTQLQQLQRHSISTTVIKYPAILSVSAIGAKLKRRSSILYERGE